MFLTEIRKIYTTNDIAHTTNLSGVILILIYNQIILINTDKFWIEPDMLGL